jgi:hypothetical protein
MIHVTLLGGNHWMILAVASGWLALGFFGVLLDRWWQTVFELDMPWWAALTGPWVLIGVVIWHVFGRKFQ